MQRMLHFAQRLSAGIVFVGLLFPVLGSAQEKSAPPEKPPAEWDTTLARGTTRTIDFDTSEGTWMSLSLSPDGKWIAFDLLGQIYRMPSTGGKAECLTQDSGIAINETPRYSPDGKTIAFISDRKGQNNLWLMDADGKNPRSVYNDKTQRALSPVWTPDGNYIVVQRQGTRPGMGSPFGWSLVMYHKDGGAGIALVGDDKNPGWHSVSGDGKYLYFDVQTCSPLPFGHTDPMLGCAQIQRMNLSTRKIEELTGGAAEQQDRGTSGGGIAPEVSPDGRYVAFGRRIPDGTESYKGHVFGPRTALWLRDLQTGEERLLMDPIELDESEEISRQMPILPGMAWSADGKSMVISQGGKFRRLTVDSGKVETIPFTAHVHRVISEMAYSPLPLSDSAFEAKFIRWQTASPDGKQLVFQAIDKLYVMDMPNGKPRRVTSDSLTLGEFSPAWSPDGKTIAFTSWDDANHGQLWTVSASGGAPTQITKDPGEYLNPTFSPDGGTLAYSRSSGATLRGRDWARNEWYDIVLQPLAAGEAQSVVRVSGQEGPGARPQFGSDGRIYFTEHRAEKGNGPFDGKTVTDLLSVQRDGSDRRVHATFINATLAQVSPDAQHVAYQEGDNVYIAPLPLNVTGQEAVRLDRKAPVFKITPASLDGGMYPHWRDAATVEYGNASKYFVYHLATAKTDATEIHLSVPRALPQGSLALTNARIITLANKQVIDSGTIVAKNGRITCVGTCSTNGVAQVIDAKGKTIIPGWIDMHAHHHREAAGITPTHNFESAVYLAYGVTTTLDPSTWSEDVFPLAEMIEAGKAIGPRTFSTATPLLNGSGPNHNELTSYEQAEHEITRLASYGAVALKQYLQPDREQRQWISDIARKQHLRVTAEGSSDLLHKLSMAMDGHTGFEHPTPYVPLYGDATKFFGQAHTVYSPTFTVGGTAPWNEEYFEQISDVWKEAKLQRWTPWRELMPHLRRRWLRPVTDYHFGVQNQGLADVIANGGYGAIGSHGQAHGIGSHWEVWMLASALGNMGALEVASAHGAHFLGADKDLGTLEVGKLADLMVLNANPLDDIHNTANIAMVMKAGMLYDADTLDEIWPEKKPFGAYYWINLDQLRNDTRPVDIYDQK
jgi:Tol biopolymer transport system component/imidazolonepropionase-like amidohydrolase